MPFLENTTHNRIKIFLWQVNSPNSQDKFHICFTDIYLVRFLANFTVFRVFVNLEGFCGSTSISLLCDHAKYQKPCEVVKVINNAQPIFLTM